MPDRISPYDIFVLYDWIMEFVKGGVDGSRILVCPTARISVIQGDSRIKRDNTVSLWAKIVSFFRHSARVNFVLD